MKEPLLGGAPGTPPPPHDAKQSYWRCSLLWIPILVSVAILIMVDAIEIDSYTYYSTAPQRQRLPTYREDNFTINQAGCRIPYMQPFDPSVVAFIKPPDPIDCVTNHSLFAWQGLDTIHLNASEFENNNLSLADIKCCYRPFWRVRPQRNQNDNNYEYYKICVPFITTAKIYDEFVLVECTNSSNKIVYKDAFSFVPDHKVEYKLPGGKETQKGDYLSVLVLGVDAVSRMNIHRQMPRTVDYLTNQMGAKEMLGYNKIGDNTYPNLIAVLTGQREDELQKGCLKATANERFDNCDLVWKHFNKRGYVSLYSEDSMNMGLFNYFRKGFFNLTTDYDYRVFDNVANNQIAHMHKMNSNLCFGGRLRCQVLLDYVRRFATVFAKRPYFAFNWGVSISHDYLNNPNLADGMHEALLRELHESGLLNHTAVVFMSDHGIRWGDIRSTYQGRLEERLPFLFFAFPQWFKETYQSAWANLLQNTKRLTTPFDLHATLFDLHNLTTVTQRQIRARTLDLQRKYRRGVSLFLPISKDRTCHTAGIEDHWCTCQIFEKVDLSKPVVIDVASFIVSQINQQLVGYKQCAILKLNNIKSATKGEVTHLQNKGADKVSEYTLVLSTVPGNGLFEATARLTALNKNSTKYELAGSVSRINLYGSQSRCVTDFHLKLYCYCT